MTGKVAPRQVEADRIQEMIGPVGGGQVQNPQSSQFVQGAVNGEAVEIVVGEDDFCYAQRLVKQATGHGKGSVRDSGRRATCARCVADV